MKQLSKCVLEVLVELGVENRIDHRVKVAKPQKEALPKIWQVAVLAKWNQQSSDEKR